MITIKIIDDNCIIITNEKQEDMVQINGYTLDLTIKELLQFLNDED